MVIYVKIPRVSATGMDIGVEGARGLMSFPRADALGIIIQISFPRGKFNNLLVTCFLDFFFLEGMTYI